MSKQREAFNLYWRGLNKQAGYIRVEDLWIAWQASRAAALEEAAVKAETALCDCCWEDNAVEASEEIAFQIRKMKKDES